MRLPWTMLILGTILFLVSCQEKVYAPMEKQHNRSGKPIVITVYEYGSYGDVTRALSEFQRKNKQPRTTDPSLGWAAWDLHEPYQCDIHVKTPDKIDDDDVKTLGHEMAHCLYGSYHK
jgi:hypothetical protein